MNLTTRALLWTLACTPALLAPARTGAAAGPDYSKVEIKPTKITDSITMLAGAGGNMAVMSGADGTILIDDEFAELSDKIKAAVATVTDKPVRYLINTHWHGDHTGGNENFSTGGALIVAHDNVRKQMSVEHFMKAFNSQVPPSPVGALPVITFNDSLSFHLDGDDLHVFHVKNAHTDGDAIIHWAKADVVHMGDTFFNGFYPFIDVESGGSINGMIAADDLVLARIDDNTKVIPGHGPLGTKAQLKAFRDMLAGIRDGVAQQIKAGKSMEETVAAKPGAAFEAAWGGGFLKTDRFVAMVYEDLKSRK